MDNFENRIEELETRSAYQEDTIQALNDVVAKQQAQLDKLQRSLETLAERLREAMTGDSFDDARDEPPPPHY